MGIQGLLSLALGSHRGGGPELREGPREPPPEVGGGMRALEGEEGPYLIYSFILRTWYRSMGTPPCL